MKTNAAKIEYLYGLAERLNEISVVADRKGCGEVGQLVLDAVDYVAAALGLPLDYKQHADDWRLVNEGLEELMIEYPEEG